MGHKRGYNVEVSVKRSCSAPISETFKGRLVGFITNEQRRAVINLKGAAAKVFTSESVSPNDTNIDKYNKFFVIATAEYPGRNEQVIYISPKIDRMIHTPDKQFECADGNVYILKKLD
jgi:hypothetical protein